jgi:hypothetical protein
MNAHDLLFDEVFGQLDDDRRAAADPEFARTRQEFNRVAHLMLADPTELEPPPDLSGRTLAFIREEQVEPRRPIIEFAPAASRLRWADFAVAASILLAAVAGLAPALRNSQVTASNLGCWANLNQIGQALGQYAMVHKAFPFVAPESPGSYVGAYRLMLHESKLTPDPAVFDCPCNGTKLPVRSLPGLHEVCERERQSPGAAHDIMICDYAYSQGRRDQRGFSGPMPFNTPDNYPLVADTPRYLESPARVVLTGNSPNHGGLGQNVLHAGGHVRFLTDRLRGPGDDLYMNRHDQVAPGLDEADAVLSPAVFPFHH